MRAFLIPLALAGCTAAPVAHVSLKPAIPVEWRTCPAAPHLPMPPGRIRTTEEIAAWARQLVKTYEQTQAARDECARDVERLTRMIDG